MRAVAGPILIVVVIVLALPPAFLASGLVVSALIGWLGTEHAEATHEGSELIELSR
jgi:hypothetical protein